MSLPAIPTTGALWCSANCMMILMVCSKLLRLPPTTSHLTVSMLAELMSFLRTSLKCSCGQPPCLVSTASSPYKTAFWSWPSSIQCMCASHQRCLIDRITNILGVLACLRSSVMDTLPISNTPRIQRRSQSLKLHRHSSCQPLGVQVSLLFSGVKDHMHTLYNNQSLW